MPDKPYTLHLDWTELMALIDATSFYDLDRTDYLEGIAKEDMDDDDWAVSDTIGTLQGVEKRLMEMTHRGPA